MFASQWPDYWAEEELGNSHSGFHATWRLAIWLKTPVVVAKYGGLLPDRAKAAAHGSFILRVYLLVIYAKNVRATIDGATLDKIKERLSV